MSRPIGVQPVILNQSGGAGGSLIEQHISVDAAGNPIPANLYSCNISWSGATVGDEINFYDDASALGAVNPATAKKFLSFRVPTAAGFAPYFLPAVGLRAYKGIHMVPALAGGIFNIDLGISNGGG